MPFRPRPIRWDLLVNPSMQALDIRARADSRMNQNILSGLLNLGQGIRQGAVTKENTRRFNLTNARADRAESRALKALNMEEIRQAAFDDFVAGQLGDTTQQLLAGEANGQADPKTADRHNKLVGISGGPEAAAGNVMDRAAPQRHGPDGRPCGKKGQPP